MADPRCPGLNPWHHNGFVEALMRGQTTMQPSHFTQTLLGCALAALSFLALAQPSAPEASPSAEQMIELLRKPAGMTRSLRNLAVEAAPSGAEAARPSVSLQIQFDFDSARVRPQSQQALNNLALALQSPALLSARFAVEGHTDAKGRADYNARLSQLRAEAVCDYLGRQGVDATRLVADGKGSAALANSADPFAAENRRVRIVNLD